MGNRYLTLSAEEIIDTIDPTKHQCHRCKRYLIRAFLIPTLDTSTGLPGYECNDRAGCRWWEDDKIYSWYHSVIDKKPPQGEI